MVENDIKDVQYLNKEKTMIKATIDGQELNIPVDTGNRHDIMIKNWIADGGKPKNAPTVYPYPTEASAEQAMANFINNFTDEITGYAPNDEKVAWPVKEIAAKNYIAGTATDEEKYIIETEADLTEEDYMDLANKIVFKAGVYRKVVANTAGLRRKTLNAIKNGKPKDYEAILNSAITTANQVATSLGVK
jgi:DNA-binding XRE family transcriptional regulator